MDSALKTAISIIDSWRKNYVKGEREKPAAKRLFLRVKQTLLKLEGDKLRITIDGECNYALDTYLSSLLGSFLATTSIVAIASCQTV